LDRRRSQGMQWVHLHPQGGNCQEYSVMTYFFYNKILELVLTYKNAAEYTAQSAIRSPTSKQVLHIILYKWSSVSDKF